MVRVRPVARRMPMCILDVWIDREVYALGKTHQQMHYEFLFSFSLFSLKRCTSI